MKQINFPEVGTNIVNKIYLDFVFGSDVKALQFMLIYTCRNLIRRGQNLVIYETYW